MGNKGMLSSDRAVEKLSLIKTAFRIRHNLLWSTIMSYPIFDNFNGLFRSNITNVSIMVCPPDPYGDSS